MLPVLCSCCDAPSDFVVHFANTTMPKACRKVKQNRSSAQRKAGVQTKQIAQQVCLLLFSAAQIFGLLTKCQGKHSGRGWGQEKKMPYGIIQSILSFFSGSKPWRKGGSGLPLPLILAVGREQDCAPIFGRQRCPRSKSAACAGLFGRRDCPAR